MEDGRHIALSNFSDILYEYLKSESNNSKNIKNLNFENPLL